MSDLAFADGVIERIRARGGRQFDERGYLFVLGAIEFLQGRLEVRRHVTGQELAEGCRLFAQQQYGLLARDVLECWGITRTADFGRIVYALVEIGLLVTQPDDREDDFADVFDFAEGFDEAYEWRGLSRG